MKRVPTFTLNIQQGATYDQTFTWKDETGTPINLTGWTAKAQIREDVADASVLFELSTVNGRIVLGGVAGTIQLLIPATDTDDLTFTEGVYDLFLYGPSSTRKLLSGTVNVVPSVTR